MIPTDYLPEGYEDDPVACELAGDIAAGHLPAPVDYDPVDMAEAARRCDPTHPYYSPTDGERHCDEPEDSTGTARFFDSRPILAHILAYARARMASPWGVFGVVLTRVLAATEPGYRGPAIVGGALSPNFGVILVGSSGQGKGASEAVGTTCIDIGTTRAGDFGLTDLDTFPLGSGEGVVTTFRPAGTPEDAGNQRNRAIFTAPEIDTLTALASRTGATIDAVLRSMLVGEQLGFSNSGKTTRTLVQAGSYRATLRIGAQPSNSGPFLDMDGGGLPQRFVWFDTSDIDAPDDTPDCPAPLRVVLPSVVTGDYTFAVPDEVRAEIRAHRLRVLRKDPDVDPLDGHRMSAQVKVAVGLALLDGRPDVSSEDWRLARTVMRVSSRVRADVQAVLADRKRAANRAKAEAEAERNTIIEESSENRKLNRAMTRIRKVLADDGRATRSALNRALRVDVRDYLDDALTELRRASVVNTDGKEFWLTQ